MRIWTQISGPSRHCAFCGELCEIVHLKKGSRYFCSKCLDDQAADVNELIRVVREKIASFCAWTFPKCGSAKVNVRCPAHPVCKALAKLEKKE
jgi:hypothetical protein